MAFLGVDAASEVNQKVDVVLGMVSAHCRAEVAAWACSQGVGTVLRD